MKKIIPLACVTLITVCIVSCFKKEVANLSSAYAMLNGKTWGSQDISAMRTSSDRAQTSVQFSVNYKMRKTLSKVFTIKNIKAVEGKQRIFSYYSVKADSSFSFEAITDSCTAHYYTSYGDYSDDNYQVLEGQGIDNYIDIKSYDAKMNRISGTFQVTMLISSGHRYDGLPDTLHFTNGRFNVHLSDPTIVR